MRSLAQIALAISVLMLPAAIFIPCGAPSCTDGVLQLSEFLTFAILFGIIIGAVLYIRATRANPESPNSFGAKFSRKGWLLPLIPLAIVALWLILQGAQYLLT